MSLSNATLKLPLPETAPQDEQEAAAALEKAASLVEDFARQSATAALQALCSLSESGRPAETAREARILAAELSNRSRLLDDEVARYLATRPDSAAALGTPGAGDAA